MDRTPPTALIIEDDSLFCRIFEHLLSSWSPIVVTATTLARAIVLMKQRDFDIYLIDHKLPDGDSSDLLSEIHLHAETDSRCVVVTSFPAVASAMVSFPIVDKNRLNMLWPHLVRILGPPGPKPCVDDTPLEPPCILNEPERSPHASH